MNTLQSIQKSNYLANENDIEKMAREYYEAQEHMSGTRTTYFRALVANVQAAISGKPTLRSRGGTAQLTEAEVEAHLKAFEDVNAKLYGAVIRGTVTPDVADTPGLREEERRRRSMERNRRNTFARSSASTLRAYIKAGNDVTRLSCLTISKSAIGKTNVPVSTEERLRRRVKSSTTRLTALITDLAGIDKAAAVAALQDTMAEASTLLLKYGGRPATKAEQAVAEQKLWRTQGGVFWPTRSEARAQ